MDPVISFDPPFGLRRTRSNDPYVQLLTHSPALTGQRLRPPARGGLFSGDDRDCSFARTGRGHTRGTHEDNVNNGYLEPEIQAVACSPILGRTCRPKLLPP